MLDEATLQTFATLHFLTVVETIHPDCLDPDFFGGIFDGPKKKKTSLPNQNR